MIHFSGAVNRKFWPVSKISRMSKLWFDIVNVLLLRDKPRMLRAKFKCHILPTQCQVSAWQSATLLAINCKSVQPVPARVDEPVNPVRQSSYGGAGPKCQRQCSKTSSRRSLKLSSIEDSQFLDG